MAAAARAELNNYLRQVLLIADAAVRTALNTQGLESLEDFVALTEKDIDDICSNARKPGGTIPNPAYQARNNPAAPPFLPNAGVQIGHVFVKRLKMLRFYLFHLRRVQRPFQAATATLDVITALYRMYEQEQEEDETKDLPEKLTSVEKVRYTIENIDNYLIRKRGSSGAPLAYVVRESIAPPNAAEDLGFGLPSYSEEMIQRAPHDGIYYQQDNKLVWDVIRHVTHEGPGWSWVQAFQRTRDGRAAYLSIKSHYLGESFTARLRSNADQLMENTFYDGKSRSFTFEKYCEVLKGAFTDVESTGEDVSEQRKVRILLHGIHDSRLQQAKSQVLATPNLKSTFDNAVNFIAQFLDEKRSYTSTQKMQPRNVSGVQARYGRGGRYDGRGRGRGRGTSAGRGRGRGRGDGRGRFTRATGTVSDKYYTPDEWAALTLDQQQKVRELREKSGDKRRPVQSVGSRSVRWKDEEPAAATVSTITQEVTTDSKASGVGMVMSQRNRNF